VAALAATLEAVIPCHAQMPVLGQIACDPDRHGRIEALLIEGTPTYASGEGRLA
jgi:hypothetical protein